MNVQKECEKKQKQAWNRLVGPIMLEPMTVVFCVIDAFYALIEAGCCELFGEEVSLQR